MLPLVELVEQCRGAVDEVIDVTGRAVIQAVLELSAQQVTGGELSQPGKKRSTDIVRWGRQPGRVKLSNRKLRVQKPRRRKRSGGEVAVPAYAAMQDDERLGARMLDLLMKGVSTRNYAGVIGAMAGAVGVSKSAVSRETIEAAEKSIDEVLARRFDELDLLVIYVDGLIFSGHTVLAAVGVDRQGNKHVLGLQQAATENAAAAEDLLTSLVERGISPEKNRLFVLDGSKALRAAVRRVFGEVPVQRCRAHKLRNVLERLPRAERDQAKAAIRAAWRLAAQDGRARLEKLAQWYEGDWPEAAASLREGLEECFTINRLGLPPSLHRCLATTNIVESPHAGVRQRTRRVTRWKDAAMVRRWAAAAFLDTEKSFRKIMGYKDLWMLDAVLNPTNTTQPKAA
jgi:transposase-like protein